MSLSCVGEFTVFCNLIPNKVTQQILLSQMDAAELSPFFFFFFCSEKAAQTGHNEKMFPAQTVCLQAELGALLLERFSTPASASHSSLPSFLRLFHPFIFFLRSPLIHTYVYISLVLWRRNIHWSHFDNFETASHSDFSNSPLWLNWFVQIWRGRIEHYRRIFRLGLCVCACDEKKTKL